MTTLPPLLTDAILAATGAESLQVERVVQSLWSGYGQILRLALTGGEHPTVIVKHVHAPSARNHPRGWNASYSHERKLRSYRVETAWYQDWSHHCGASCRIPKLIGSKELDGQQLLILEDLDAAGFHLRKSSLSAPRIESCLAWLAEFHATFLNKEPQNLWATGTYWHLATRPDELAALTDPTLKAAAAAIDHRLSAARYQTLVHGDAKLANFCFGPDDDAVAALDFQYVGGGCGMKDLAYFLGSCLDEESCEAREGDLLDCYFGHLTEALARHQRALTPQGTADLVAEWRGLYPFAWADFHRFLRGWSPGHWKLNSYGERLARQAIEEIARAH